MKKSNFSIWYLVFALIFATCFTSIVSAEDAFGVDEQTIERHIYYHRDSIHLYDSITNYIINLYDNDNFSIDLFASNIYLGTLDFNKTNDSLSSVFIIRDNNNLNSMKYYSFFNKRVLLKSEYSRPERERILSVRGVPQEGPTCWAATCAMIINYMKNENLSAYDVSYNITGDPHIGGTNYDVARAFRNWNLAPREEHGILSFSDVCREIDNGCPIYARLDSYNSSHAVPIIGYTEWGSDMNYERGYTIIEPNGARRVYELERNGFSHILNVDGERMRFDWADTITVR